MDQRLLKAAINTGRPIPGQSLTSNPDDPAPYEKPPKFTNLQEAVEDIFINLTKKEVYIPLLRVLNDGVPIMNITQTVLFKGFTDGKWNPDLMMLLVEPTAYMLLAFSERAGIEPVIYDGEEEDEIEEQRLYGVKHSSERLEKIKKLKENKIIPQGALSSSIEQQIEELPTAEESQEMMQEAPETETESGSLLSPPQNVEA